MLEEVYHNSKLIAPTCNESISLIVTVEIILNLRKFVVSADWFTMKDYYDEVKESTCLSSFNPKSLQEFHDCDQIVKVSCATSFSIHGYTNGCFNLLPGDNLNRDIINFDSLNEALQIYDFA